MRDPHYFAKDGLMCLYRQAVQPESCDNDNGILFLAEYIAMQTHVEPALLPERHIIAYLLSSLQAQAGLYDRKPGAKYLREAHDNYVGICYLSALYNTADRRDIFDYGSLTGFNYNNIDPAHWRIETQRQGSDIAFYAIMAGRSPSPFYLIWLCVGLAFFSHDHLLTWMRVQAISLMRYSNPMYLIARFIWRWRAGDNLSPYFHNYFQDKNHPIHGLINRMGSEGKWMSEANGFNSSHGS